MTQNPISHCSGLGPRLPPVPTGVGAQSQGSQKLPSGSEPVMTVKLAVKIAIIVVVLVAILITMLVVRNQSHGNVMAVVYY